MKSFKLAPGLLLIAAALLAGGCASTPPTNLAATDARVQLNALKEDPQLATCAPAALADAEEAVRAAEVAQNQRSRDADHLAYLADRKVAIARAQAQDRIATDQMTAMAAERDRIQLDARTREAQAARTDAQQALSEARTQHEEAQWARQQAYMAQAQAQSAQQQADLAMMEATDYKRQLDELQARESDRGMVVTLGDVLFASGRADLKAGNQSRLEKLALFLDKYPDRTVIVEGHTDNRGSDDMNQRLSQRRAEAVRQYLVANGVSPSRIKAVGKGESVPVAGNDDAAGRQQNRRVEVVIQGS